MKTLIVLALAFTAAQPVWAQAEDPRVRTAETRLGPAVEIAGRPSPARTLAETMVTMQVPGVSIAVIENKRIAWAKGYGVIDAGGATVATGTRFQAGSISKPIAALTVLRLVAEGKLSLDTPVNSWLKDWKLPDGAEGPATGVTLRRLLSHTAGTSVRGFPGYAIGGPVPSLSEVLDGRAPANTEAVRIVAAPGAAWRYSGGGYTIAQKIVEDVTGQRFAAWAAGGLLVPAGMTASSFDPPGAAPHALGHRADGATVTGGYHLYPEAAAAGLWSTPSDLARAMLALGASMDGRPGAILPAVIARIVLEPVQPGHSVGFDTGGAPDARWIAKGGDTEGFAAYLVYYPARGQGAVVMTNGAQGSVLARDVMRSIAGTYGWPDFRARIRQVSAIPSALRENLPGTYVFRKSDSFIVARTEEGLSFAWSGGAPEALYRDPSGEWFTQSEDLAFVFDAAGGGGHIQSGVTAIPFRKKDN